MAAIGPQVRIRDLRVAHGLSLADLADRIAGHGIAVSVEHLCNVECGRRKASRPLVIAWARALGVDPLDVTQPDRPSRTAAADEAA